MRLTMAFAGPPEDDIDWADVSPAGSAKFLARAWRLADDVTSAPDVDWKTGDAALRRVTHRFLADAPGLIEAFKFNVVVARLMELVNATRKAIDSGPGAGDAAVREATEVVAVALSLFAPYTAEDMWEKLGYQRDRGARRLAQARPDAADRGVGHGRSCRSTARCATGSRSPRRSRPTSSRSWRGRRMPWSRSIGDREIVERDRARLRDSSTSRRRASRLTEFRMPRRSFFGAA